MTIPQTMAIYGQNALFRFNQLVTANTGGNDPKPKGTVTQNLLTGLIAYLGPVIGICVVIFCVYQGFQLFKGSEGASVKKLLSGIAIFLLIIGIMYASGSISVWGDKISDATDSVITGIADDSSSIVNGSAGNAVE